MPTSYYLACLETCRYVWIGTFDDTTSTAGVDAGFISSFCLEHRGKALTVVNETHQVVEEGDEWARCTRSHADILKDGLKKPFPKKVRPVNTRPPA